MKPHILLLTCLLLSISSLAQKTYNNKIDHLDELNIYGKNNKVIVGKIIIKKTLESKLYLISSNSEIDSLNNYLTTIWLGNHEKVPLFGPEVFLEFSKPVMNVNPGPFGGGTFWGRQDTLTTDKLNYYFRAQQVTPLYPNQAKLRFRIYSKEKISVKISGVAGELPTNTD
jgi:hypothetical protein